MTTARSLAILLGGVLLVGTMGKSAVAQSSGTQKASPKAAEPRIERARIRPAISSDRTTDLGLRRTNLALAQATDSQYRREGNLSLSATENERKGETQHTHDYKEISDFFNIREANANVVQGEWEHELEATWFTDSAGGDDDVTFSPNLKYGITDDMFVEVEVLPINFGDGSDQGNGDLAVQWFNQFVHETDSLPAFAAWVEMRIPTGEGSSGVDAELHLNLTKTIAPKFRMHLEGFIETANGGRGDEDEDRRPFQWGAGPGFDYQFDEKTIGAVNYLLRSSEETGDSDQNILELGAVRQIAENQHLKFAVDIGLDGYESTPNFGAKILWSIEW